MFKLRVSHEWGHTILEIFLPLPPSSMLRPCILHKILHPVGLYVIYGRFPGFSCYYRIQLNFLFQPWIPPNVTPSIMSSGSVGDRRRPIGTDPAMKDRVGSGSWLKTRTGRVLSWVSSTSSCFVGSWHFPKAVKSSPLSNFSSFWVGCQPLMTSHTFFIIFRTPSYLPVEKVFLVSGGLF